MKFLVSFPFRQGADISCPRDSLLPAQRQQGAALVLVLVVVLLVTTIAVGLSQQFDFDLRRGMNRDYSTTAHYYLLGAESLGVVALRHDSQTSNDIDHLGEQWAQQTQPFPVEGGAVSAQLYDAQGRFNVNLLRGKPSAATRIEGDAGDFTASQRRFIRFLQTFESLNIDQAQAMEMTQSLMDWLDSDDQVTGFGGAESMHYDRQSPRYRPANQPMVDITELVLVRHYSPDIVAIIGPWLSAVPDNGRLNINTAHSRLLRTINYANELTPLDNYSAERLAEQRQDKPYGTIEELFANPEFAERNNRDRLLLAEGLSVSSDYFFLVAKASVGGKERSSETLLQRNEYGVTALRRKYL